MRRGGLWKCGTNSIGDIPEAGSKSNFRTVIFHDRQRCDGIASLRETLIMFPGRYRYGLESGGAEYMIFRHRPIVSNGL
uniref:Uncharacterized protein n=1 Tax=Candidatus Kentrum sp. FW TaxID=2126338 RepID=A0A450SAY2_9GAMM|nr:MAG: hypothetical protein BECKFW1821B_GA0114236_10026 [Candidatus Kentron sp. FW]VFJ49271.1 MAG: hypothetical protein BECKFW1821A_GA0114235_102237 [Candidatus Kentron sp. FW]